MTLKETALAKAQAAAASAQQLPVAEPKPAAKPAAQSNSGPGAQPAGAKKPFTSFVEPEAIVYTASKNEKTPVVITLQNGVTVEGTVLAWGNYTVAIQPRPFEGRNKLIYKNAIAYVEFGQTMPGQKQP
jgi:RNA chaperone Hfq